MPLVSPKPLFLGRRSWAAVFVVAAGLASGCVDRSLRAEFTRADRALLEHPGLQVVLCGTGSGLPDSHRAGPCTAIIAAGELFLVDVGPGAWRSVDLLGLPVADLHGIFLTKLLADDVADLGEAMTRSWLDGREGRLAVYGPPGTARFVGDLVDAYQFDVALRLAHHDPANMRPELAGADAHEFSLDGSDGSALVLERGGLRVRAFSVAEAGQPASVGYRFDYRGRSIVIAGHARHNANLVKFAAGADVLIHEATHPGMMERGIRVMDELGLVRTSKFGREMVRALATPLDAAEVARDAGVGSLVLTRLLPPPDTFLTRWMFLAGVRDVFPSVVLGSEGLRIRLDPRP